MKLIDIVEIVLEPHIVKGNNDMGKLCYLNGKTLERALKCKIQRITAVGNEVYVYIEE